MLLLKLFLVPLLLLATSLAGRRWGPRVAGRLAGLPVVVGPILLVLTLEHGDTFGVQAAVSALAGLAAVLTFNLAYAHACRRAAWPLAWLAAGLGWLAMVGLLSAWAPGWIASAVLALGGLAIVPRLFPPVEATASPRPVTNRDLAVRMVMGALLTLAITTAAADLGPAWSGLVTTFPVITTVLAVSSHRGQGPAFTVSLLRGMVTGMAGFAAFCIVLSLTLTVWGRPLAFLASVLGALSTQVFVKGTLGSLLRSVRGSGSVSA
jgi:hypothetical protein